MTHAAVMATLEEYARTYCSKDIDGLMAVFDDCDEISVIGTGADELCCGRTQVRELFLRNFNEARVHRFDWDWRHATIDGGHAVVAVSLRIDLELDGARSQVPLRWTVSLRRREGRWVWLHRHASSPASDQGDGWAYPTGDHRE